MVRAIFFLTTIHVTAFLLILRIPIHNWVLVWTAQGKYTYMYTVYHFPRETNIELLAFISLKPFLTAQTMSVTKKHTLDNNNSITASLTKKDATHCDLKHT